MILPAAGRNYILNIISHVTSFFYFFTKILFFYIFFWKLMDRQVLWASIEVFILALIFVVCLRKRQPSLPPNLVAKVLDDLLQTQHFSPNRRRNSESNIKQSSIGHCEVVRQKSADDLSKFI